MPARRPSTRSPDVVRRTHIDRRSASVLFCFWHEPPVRCTAAMPSGYRVTFTVRMSPPAFLAFGVGEGGASRREKWVVLNGVRCCRRVWPGRRVGAMVSGAIDFLIFALAIGFVNERKNKNVRKVRSNRWRTKWSPEGDRAGWHQALTHDGAAGRLRFWGRCPGRHQKGHPHDLVDASSIGQFFSVRGANIQQAVWRWGAVKLSPLF